MVFLKLERFPLGLAAAQDVKMALERVRKSGKRIVVFLGNARLKEYLIASAADEIHMDPAGTLEILGLRSSRYYIKGTLDKVGVEPELYAKGKYKSAPETFTRKSASSASKQATMERLRRAETEVRKSLATQRKSVSQNWKAIVQQGLFSAQQAKDEGLIDAVGSFSPFAKEIENRLSVRTNLTEKLDSLALPSRVSVIVASGDIVQNSSSLLSLGGMNQITPKNFNRKLKTAMADPLTKAIVVRVNSPGGEILPSQQIAASIQNASKKKPIYVSMGDVAASGGYFIAAPAKKIFAEPLTVTGSIGVFLGKVNLQKLYEKIDLKKEVTSFAPYASLFSEHKPASAEEKRILLKRLDHYYGFFIDHVATFRNLSQQAAENAAQGRVWLGAKAKELRLVDSHRSYLEAIEYAANDVDLREGDYEYKVIQNRGGLFSLFGSSNSFVKEDSPLGWLPPELLRELSQIQQSDANYLYLSNDTHLE